MRTLQHSTGLRLVAILLASGALRPLPAACQETDAATSRTTALRKDTGSETDPATHRVSPPSAEGKLLKEDRRAARTLVDSGQAAALSFSEYPTSMKPRGIRERVTVKLSVDADGRVSEAKIGHGSLLPAFNEAALKVARKLRFRTIFKVGKPTGQSLKFPVSFSPRFQSPGAVVNYPELDAYEKELLAHTPGARGLNGVAVVTAVVDTSGTVPRAEVTETSGEPILDSLALLLARRHRYEPAPHGVGAGFVRGRIVQVFGKVKGAFPRLVNRSEIVELVKKYARDYRRCGTVSLWLNVSDEGRATEIVVGASSGDPLLDDLLVSLAWRMRFAPATEGEFPVSTWVAQPLTVGGCDERSLATTPLAHGAGPLHAAALSGDSVPGLEPKAPSADSIQMEMRRRLEDNLRATWELLNPGQAATLADLHYPAEMKPFRVVESVLVKLSLNADGTVKKAKISKGSVLPPFNEAALAVARQLRFQTVLKNGKPVKRSLKFPISFRPRSMATLANGAEVKRLKKEFLARTPGASGMKGVAVVAATFDASGRVLRAEIARGSGEAVLDSLAVRLAFKRRYEPAPRGGNAGLVRDRVVQTFGKVEWKYPKLANRLEIGNLLENYAAGTRCGIATLWVLAAEGGWARRVEVRESSGDPVLDNLAETVAWRMRFKPGTADGQPVAMWVQIPVHRGGCNPYRFR